MSDTFAKKFSSVYFVGNFNSPAPQAFCGNLRSIVITYESVCKRLSIHDVEARLDGFHSKLLSSCQEVAYIIYLILKNFL